MDKEKVCGKFDTTEFKADEMCCVCGGGDGNTRVSLSLAAKYLGKDSIAGKYLPQDISYAGYAAIAVFALPTLLFMILSSPFLLIAQMLGADFIKGHEEIIAEIIPLSVALFMVLLVSCVIIKTRNSRKGRDDF